MAGIIVLATAAKGAIAASAARVPEYKLALAADGKTYQLTVISSVTPKPDISLTGQVPLMANSDPFNTAPNSANTNPGNQFTNLGWGAVSENNYKGNYGVPVVCPK
ncbi:MAG: hypothetical protein PHE17_20260 [Thiothrix sp.]|uniref:hypothetical protein n=1 Tax=Thiothrix sp. TaxID=1032 RepID=UPI00261CC120|nr:hypothetical protein [Thiothrix sp.]MDD5395364.1 hypothetical protein [Thiothrix sp.]